MLLRNDDKKNVNKKRSIGMNKKAFREICATAARVWPMTAEPGHDPIRFEHYEFVGEYWVRVIVERNGEEAPPHRREGEMTDDEKQQRDEVDARGINFLRELDLLSPETDAKKRREDLGSDRSIDA